MSPASCIYRGRVTHSRLRPVAHAFDYRLFMMYLDLGELPGLFDPFRGWSAGGPAPAWFRREDHMGDPARPLADCVRDLVAGETGHRPGGPVRILTHLRYFGHCFNPVSFYYCHGEAGGLRAVVAEVHNTPWGERHCYVLPAEGAGEELRHRVPKAFHVSPFMGMEMDYEFRLAPPGERLSVSIGNFEDGEKIFGAALDLERREITAGNLRRVLWGYPLMTLRVVAAIYWQALLLWRKGATYHPHPGAAAGEGMEVEP